MTHYPHHTLTQSEIKAFLSQLFKSEWSTLNDNYDPVMFDVLAYAASREISIHRACSELKNVPSDTTVRNYLSSFFEDMEQAEKIFNRSLQSILPPRLHKRKRRRIAMDVHLQPYYGVYEKENSHEQLRKSYKKGGTHVHWSYATAYLCHEGVRYTLAFTYVRNGERMHSVVLRLMNYMSKVRFVPTLAMLDREFYVVSTMKYFKRKKIRFIIPAKTRGAKLWNVEEHPQKTRKEGMDKGWYTYQMNKAKEKSRRLKVDLAIVRRHFPNKRGGIRKETWGYACWGVKGRRPEWVKNCYSRRFGIESSYRQANQSKIRTCTRNPMLRFLFMFITLYLRQVWVWLHDTVLSKRRQGGREMFFHALPYDRMLNWLAREFELQLGFIEEIESKQDIKQEFEKLKKNQSKYQCKRMKSTMMRGS